MTYASNELPVKSRTDWADLDVISEEINRLGLTYNSFGHTDFEGESFEFWIERPARYALQERVHIYPKKTNALIPRGCRMWIYFFGDEEVSLAVLRPWDQQRSLGSKIDIGSKDPMSIWTTVVHNPVHCRCKNAKQFQPDWSE